MEVSVLKGILCELKKEGYRGVLSFSRYNEPMSRNSLFKKRLRQIKEILPDNKLVTNTNGDFLSKAALDGLLIDELTVMDYDCLGIEKCLDKLKKVNAVIEEVAYPYIHAKRKDMDILYFVDWQERAIVSDRGGSLKEYGKVKRTVPCFEPFYFIGINYDGTVSPCCNIRNDIEKHRPYILGDLHGQTLREILSNEKALAFQKDCKEGIFLADSPCCYCMNRGGRYTKEKGGIQYG